MDRYIQFAAAAGMEAMTDSGLDSRPPTATAWA